MQQTYQTNTQTRPTKPGAFKSALALMLGGFVGGLGFLVLLMLISPRPKQHIPKRTNLPMVVPFVEEDKYIWTEMEEEQARQNAEMYQTRSLILQQEQVELQRRQQRDLEAEQRRMKSQLYLPKTAK